jgi:hypothetical protein
MVWRVAPSGEILPWHGFIPRLDGDTPATLAEILNHYGIDAPDSATMPRPRSPATPIGLP